MSLIDRDWLLEHERCYSFKEREDVVKFINDAPEEIDTLTAELIYKRREELAEEIKCLKIRWQELGQLLDMMEEIKNNK